MGLIIRLSRKVALEGKMLEGWMNLRLEGYSNKEVEKVIEVWKERGWLVINKTTI